MRKLVADDSTGVSAFRVVEIDFRPPVAAVHPAVETTLRPNGVHVAVAPHGGRVVTLLHTVGEPVTARRTEVFRTERAVHLPAEFLLPEQRRIDDAERTGLERSFQTVGFARFEPRRARLQVDGTRGAEVLGGLEHGAFLPIVERHRLHVVEREAPQIDASVVLDLDAREVTQRVGYVVRIEPLEAFTRELLHGNHFPADNMARHNDFLYMLKAIQTPLRMYAARNSFPRKNQEE